MARRNENSGGKAAQRGNGGSGLVDPTALRELLEAEGLRASDAEREQLGRYLNVLMRWAPKVNLVGPSDWREVVRELVADSFHLAAWLRSLESPAEPLCLDLGAGAGLPGLPLRALWTAGRYVLVEIRGKRVAFLRTAVVEMGLDRVEVRQERAEDALQALGPADIVISRAFMPWSKVLELVREHVRPGGLVVIMSNDQPPDDLGPDWRLRTSHAYAAAGRERYFWGLEPSLSTPASMPR